MAANPAKQGSFDHRNSDAVKMGLREDDFVALLHKRKIIPDHLTIQQVHSLNITFLVSFIGFTIFTGKGCVFGACRFEGWNFVIRAAAYLPSLLFTLRASPPAFKSPRQH